MPSLLRTSITAAASLVFLLLASNVHAHGGGLNSDGCHANRKTGDYHCHRAPNAATPQARGFMSADPQRAQPAAAARSAPQQGYEPGKCYVGPRGGTYTITKSGRKNYSGC